MLCKMCNKNSPSWFRVYTELSVWEYQDLIQGLPFQGQVLTCLPRVKISDVCF